ncbi:cytochrome P450 [Polyplosphaeria fusca]|uniref:Cytochrome P450 n=1 Tax=Polyplosphaeria fusca TaxID=682080 RepID=A0A9P4QX43_9PLEO|nr:cytochrome P450 [Polyplosphaeria fusca]
MLPRESSWESIFNPKKNNGKIHSNIIYPAGPTPFPLVGNVFSFIRLMKDTEKTLVKLAAMYGETCMLWLGKSPVLVINSPIAAKELLDKRGMLYSSRPTQNDFRAEAWPYRLVTTPTGDTFRLLRRIYHNLLGPQQSAGFRIYQDFESKVLMNALLERPEGFLMDTERFAMSVIFSASYGVRLAKLDHPIMTEYYAIWESMLKYFQPGSLAIDFLPFLCYLPKFLQPWRKLAMSLRAREMKLNRAFLHTIQTQVKQGTAPECFGSLLIKVQEEELLSDDRVCDILAMLIGAGSDTTSSYLQSFFKVIALHPHVLEKAQEELDRVVGPSRMPTWSDEMSLPYVRAVIKEVHRWAPIGSLGIPHATTKDDSYHGKQIPRGTVVFPNLTALSRSPERYENADLFDPDRFLGDDLDASSSALDSDYKKRDHFHYGFGRRLCQGIFVAEASLYIAVSRALWGLEITPDPTAPPLDMGAKLAGVVTKPVPYRLSIKCRTAAHEHTIRQALRDSRTDILNFDDIVVDR